MDAKGLLAGVEDAPPNEAEKLNADEPPPEPKANWDPPFWVGGLGAGLAEGKLCDCPKLKPFAIGCWDADGEETVLGSRELNGPLNDEPPPPPVGVPARGRRRTSLILSKLSVILQAVIRFIEKRGAVEREERCKGRSWFWEEKK